MPIPLALLILALLILLYGFVRDWVRGFRRRWHIKHSQNFVVVDASVKDLRTLEKRIRKNLAEFSGTTPSALYPTANHSNSLQDYELPFIEEIK